MDEHVRWVTKAEAAREMEISLSTLDRRIRSGEVEVVREGRWVYVRMHRLEYVGDDELLRRAIAREEELERTVRQLEQSVSELKLRASELKRERDEARESSDGLTKSLRGRTRRRSPSTRRRRKWSSQSAGPPSCCSCCWSPAFWSRGYYSSKSW